MYGGGRISITQGRDVDAFTMTPFVYMILYDESGRTGCGLVTFPFDRLVNFAGFFLK